MSDETAAITNGARWHGLCPRLPWADYALLGAVNISSLKEIGRSPQHYRHRTAHPKETTAMRLGTAAHCAVLEPGRFASSYAVWDARTEGNRLRPRRGKEWDAFVAKAEAEGRAVLTEDEAMVAIDIQLAVRAAPAAMRYLAHGEPEVSMRWQWAGFECKGRVDWLTAVDGVDCLVGLKTTRDCRLYQFGSQAAKLGYHMQWAFYHDGFHVLQGRAPKVVEIVVESAPPYAVAVYVIPSDIIEQGREDYERLLTILGDCRAADHWPGPTVEELELSLPSWVYGDVEDDIADLGLDA